MKTGAKKRMNYYEILGVSETSSSEEIKQAYLKIAARYNPDTLFIDKTVSYNEAVRKIVLINEAYNALSDPVKRKILDKKPKIAQKEIHDTEKKFESSFETTIRYKIEQLKNEKIKSVRERAEETFSEKKKLLRDEISIVKTESVRDRLERKQRESLEKETNPDRTFIEPETIDTIPDEKIEEILRNGSPATDKEISHFEYSISDNSRDAFHQEPKQEKQRKAEDSAAGIFNKQELFFRAVKLMDKKKYAEAMKLFTALIALSETYPYIYVIKACQCGFFRHEHDFIHQKTLEAMYAYVSSKWLTFLLDAPDNNLFRMLLELFFQNFALCSLNKKIDLKELLKAENEVFHIVKQLAKTNPKIMGFAGLYSAIAYADLALLYKETSFLMKALDKLNYVPEELYDRKKKRRFNRMLKYFFKRKEIRQFRLIYPFLRTKKS